MDKADVIQRACRAAAAGQEFAARELLRAYYPFQPIPKVKRAGSLRQSIAIFERDGFIARYKGTRLVFPGALFWPIFVILSIFSLAYPWGVGKNQ